MNFKRVSVLGLPLDVGGDAAAFCELLQRKNEPQSIAFVGPGAWWLARKDKTYAETLSKLSLILPDGLGVALACRLLTNDTCHPIGLVGTSASLPLFDTIIKNELSIGLVGGAPGNDEEMHGKLSSAHRELKVSITSHGYGDVIAKIAKILAAAPDLILVSMESPRQEAFIIALRDAGYKGMTIACGDFFDRYQTPAYHAPIPEMVSRWHLNFLYRLYQEPHRLWRRYLIDYPLFYVLVLKNLLIELIAKIKVLAAQASKKPQF